MTPDEHARRADSLADLARSASMGAPWNRTRRREILAAAQVHATLATRPAGSELVGVEFLRQAEVDLEVAKGRYEDYERAIKAIEHRLGWYGQDFTGGLDDVVDRVGELMDLAYNNDRAGKPQRARVTDGANLFGPRR